MIDCYGHRNGLLKLGTGSKPTYLIYVFDEDGVKKNNVYSQVLMR